MTTARALLATLVLAAALAASARAAAPAGTAAAPPTATPTATPQRTVVSQRTATSPRPASGRVGAGDRPGSTTSVTRKRAPADTSGHTRPKVAPRTLDDIHIEGEIPVPQVLFITAREQRRFMEFQHHRYQRTSLELGRATATPSRIVVTSPSPAERKENQR